MREGPAPWPLYGGHGWPNRIYQPRRLCVQGFPASQWVTVYNKHAPMKQR